MASQCRATCGKEGGLGSLAYSKRLDFPSEKEQIRTLLRTKDLATQQLEHKDNSMSDGITP